MSSSVLAAGLRQLRRQLAAPPSLEDSDERLLTAFTSHRDDTAFAVLVQRHGPMVLSVCRRQLGHEYDAEDVFQATFLVLARNAASLRKKGSLASFLHGTAYRLARDFKRSAARRRKHESALGALTRPRSPEGPADDISWREVRTVLDDEIARLPGIYRSVFVLCCLENLSRAEAARCLGLKECTLLSRLAKARKRLSQRLARRGVELTAVLAATALATPRVSALPAGLMAEMMKAVGAASSGNELTDIVSASVATLVKKSAPILQFGKFKLAMLLFAVSLLASGAALAPWGLPPEAPQERSRGADAAPLAQPAAAPAGKSAVYAGRVLDPDGKPVEGAKLYLLYYTPKELPIPARATSDKDGRFRFTVAHKEFDQSLSTRPWDEAMVVAMAKDYGIGLPNFSSDQPKLPIDWQLRLVKDDVPITGRIIDLQGKPVAGVSVRIHELYRPRKEDLTAWLGALKERKEGYPTLGDHLNETGGLWMGRDLGKVFPPVTTGADGRFVLRGVGRERVVALRLHHATVAATDLFVMTRPGETIRVSPWRRGNGGDDMIFCGSTFEHIAAPAQIIVGVVRDKDSGKPIPGAVVQSYIFASPRNPRNRLAGQTQLRAVTNKDGRYRLDGMPKGKGNEIRASGPDGEPYLMCLATVPEAFALEPVTVDFQLKRGVWIQGKVTEKTTGKPVQCGIGCSIHDENPFRKEAPGLTFEHNLWSRLDGTYRFVGLPGRSVVTAQTGDPRYLKRVGADQIKDLNRFNLFQPFNAVVEINPEKDAKEVRCDIALETGRNLSGKVLDPDGRSLAGAKVAGLGHPGQWEGEALRTDAFTLLSLHPNETRLLQFAHAEKHLAGSLAVRGDAKEPLSVTLKRAATLTGRFITPDGKPLGNLEYRASLYGLIADPRMVLRADPAFGTFPRSLRTDKDGRFRVEDLAPGLKYRFVLYRGMYALIPDGPAGTGVTVGEGETKDLGDVTVKLIE